MQTAALRLRVSILRLPTECIWRLGLLLQEEGVTKAAVWAVYIEYVTSSGHLEASKTDAELGQSYL